MSCGNNCAGCSCGTSQRRSPEEINAYYDGLIEGVHMYAWWKDSKQYVGTTGKTFASARADLEEERAKALERVA